LNKDEAKTTLTDMSFFLIPHYKKTTQANMIYQKRLLTLKRRLFGTEAAVFRL
jgi:hypothetical protein